MNHKKEQPKTDPVGTVEPVVKHCCWNLDGDMTFYITECGEYCDWGKGNRDPVAIGYNYCPYCGNQIKIVLTLS